MEIGLLKIIIPILILLNIVVSVFIAKRDDLDSFQKKTQIVIIWLVPFIAAIGFYFINRSHDVKEENKNSFRGGKATSMDIGVSNIGGRSSDD